MTFSLNRRDIVAPRGVSDTALAISQRVAGVTPFEPTSATGGFDHATTAESTRIPDVLALGLSTGSTIADLISASTKIQDYVNTLDGLVNRVVYILEANGMTS